MPVCLRFVHFAATHQTVKRVYCLGYCLSLWQRKMDYDLEGLVTYNNTDRLCGFSDVV